MKVFKMDDYDWVAAKTIGQAIDFYLEETGCDYTDLEVRECDIEEEGMWWLIDDFPDEIKDEMDSGDTDVFNGTQYGYWCGEKAKYIKFIEAIKLSGDKKPHIIASTEY